MRPPALLSDLWVTAVRTAFPQRGAVANAREAVLRDRRAAVARRKAPLAAARAAGHPGALGRPVPDAAGSAESEARGLPLDPGQREWVADVAPTAGFASAAEDALDLLQDLVAMDLWMVTAVQDGLERVVVARGAAGMPVPPGAVQPWVESYCRLMVAGKGPRVAPRVRDVPAYAASPATRRWRIGAYLGVPLLSDDGHLFGVVCGLSVAERDDRLTAVLPEVERVARLLSTLLAKEQAAAERSQAAAQAYALADRDPGTGLLNRRGWHARVTVEEERRRRRGHVTSVLLLRLHDPCADPSGDQEGGGGAPCADLDVVMRRGAEVLTRTCRATDALARLSLTQLGVLAVDCPAPQVAHLARRVGDVLRHDGIAFTLATATGSGRQDLLEAWYRADAQVEELSALPD